MGLKIFNRATGKLDDEKIYGEKWLRFLYENWLGRWLGNIVSCHLFSKIFGYWEDSRWSARKINGFVQQFNIDLDDFEKGNEDYYSSFNAFFIRRFAVGRRIFVSDRTRMPAFAEARYLGFKKINATQVFPVKGKFLSAEVVLEKSSCASRFTDGPVLIARLCPLDYHRFHFPDDGEIVEQYRCSGKLHSVSPVALRYKSDIFATNEREVSIIKTKNFGLLAYVEVGATCVGKIVQSHERGRNFMRGDEKGYFLFGGSTVIVFGEKGAWHPALDISMNSEKGIETLVQLGQEVAVAVI